MRVALRIDVLNYPAAKRGIPAILALLEQYELSASFFVSLGPGGPLGIESAAPSGWLRRTGAALLSRLSRNGNLARDCAAELRAVQAGGHELGVAAYDERAWRYHAAEAAEEWIETAVRRSVDAYADLLGRPPTAFAAPGWQVNPSLFALEQTLGFSYASDTRGKYPYRPLLQGVRSVCPQIPVTLPTLSEVVASGAAPIDTAHQYLYAESRHLLPNGHVYAARADVEGIDHLDVLEKLLVMWKGQGGSLRTLADVRAELDLDRVPVHQVGWAQVAGNDDYVAQQSVQVPA